jgi:hypothetical protein
MGRSFGCDRKNRGPVSQQVWHDKDLSLLNGPEHWPKFCSPGNGDVSILVTNSWVGRKIVNNQSILIGRLIIYNVLRPAQEYFTYTQTSLLLDLWGGSDLNVPHLWPGTSVFPSHSKDCPIHSPQTTTHKGMWRIYSEPDYHRSPFIRLLRHTMGCRVPTLWVFLSLEICTLIQ